MAMVHLAPSLRMPLQMPESVAIPSFINCPGWSIESETEAWYLPPFRVQNRIRVQDEFKQQHVSVRCRRDQHTPSSEDEW